MKYLGNIITKSPTIPTTTAARGIWSLDEAAYYKSQNQWPVNFDPIQLISSGDFGGFYDFSNTATLWQDTAGTNAVTTTGQTILRINDRSVLGNHLTTTNGPTWNSSGYGVFNGTSSVLSKSVSQTITDFTVIIACMETTRQANVIYSFVNNIPGTGRLSAHLPWSNGNYYFDVYNATNGSGRIAGTFPHSVNTAIVASHRRGSGSIQAWTNQTSRGTASLTTSVSANIIKIGGDSTYFYAGRIYSFFFVNKALTTEERTSVENWMALRNGAF